MENMTNIFLHNDNLYYSIKVFFALSHKMIEELLWPDMRLHRNFVEIDMSFVEIADELVGGLANAAV